MFGALQPIHWIVVLVVVLIIFGPGKLPQLGSSLGQTLRDFRKATQEPEDKSTLKAPEEHCTNCGDVLQPEAKFCARCGAARPEPAAASARRND